jgi:hypothetical protein
VLSSWFRSTSFSSLVPCDLADRKILAPCNDLCLWLVLYSRGTKRE